MTNNGTDRYKEFKGIEVHCNNVDGDKQSHAEPGAFNLESDNLEYVDFTDANNFKLDGDSPKMFSGKSDFYVKGRIEVNPKTSVAAYHRSSYTLDEIKQDAESATSNAYLFSENDDEAVPSKTNAIPDHIF